MDNEPKGISLFFISHSKTLKCSFNLLTRCLPIKPSEPVTRMFFIIIMPLWHYYNHFLYERCFFCDLYIYEILQFYYSIISPLMTEITNFVLQQTNMLLFFAMFKTSNYTYSSSPFFKRVRNIVSIIILYFLFFFY